MKKFDRKFAFGVLLLFFSGISLGLIYGFIAFRFSLPPYTWFMKSYISIHSQFVGKQDIGTADIQSIIQVQDVGDVYAIRKQLFGIIWGSDLPGNSQVEYREDVDKTRYSNIEYLSHVDELIVRMDFSLESRMHLFHPIQADSSSLVIYHQGHAGDFLLGSSTIERLLGEGFTVLAASMPLLGLNNRPVVTIPVVGRMKLTQHNQLEYLKPREGIPMRYFVEPIAAALNSLDGYKTIDMIGISGGGWTTTLIASLYPRVRKSISVAGTQPILLGGGVAGEYELSTPELYGKVNYLSLYILSSVGDGRKHTQIHNTFDPCCYRGETAYLYQQTLEDLVLYIGDGEFSIVRDETHANHKISDYALRYAVAEFSQSSLD